MPTPWVIKMSRDHRRRCGLYGGDARLPQPDAITNLYAWLKADSLGLNDGDPVSTWVDSSGNNRDAAQANAALQPTYKASIINDLPVVRFDGTEYMNILSWNAGSTLTLFAVVIPAAIEPVGIFDSAPGYPNALRQYGVGAMEIWPGITRITLDLPTAPTAYLLEFLIHTSPSRQIIYYRNGTHDETDGDPSTTAVTWFAAEIGAINWGGSGFYEGDIAELILYSAELSATDRLKVEAYTNDKYGIW